MAENKRFVAIDDSELYYITDTKNLKTLDDYIKEFSKSEYEFTGEEALSVAKEEYWQMIYENSMSAKENVDWLNNLIEENKQLKDDVEFLDEKIKENEWHWNTIDEDRDAWKYKYNRLKEENEQLKKTNQRLYDELQETMGYLSLKTGVEKENKQLKQRISELKEDNDHKFWKLQFMHQYNKTQLIVHELSRAIEHGYKVSDKFQEYLNELKAHNEKGKEKAIEQEKW